MQIKNLSKKLYFILFLLSTYTILYILLYDIIRGHTYKIETKSIIVLIILFFISLMSAIKYFKKYSSYLSNNDIFILFFISLSFSILAQQTITTHESIVFNKKIYRNPLYSEFSEIAKKHNLDLSFSKDVWEQKGPINYKLHPIFKEKPHSLDILIFGDSSIAWGVIPQVIEQITHKKVAIYAYESNLLTEATAKLFKKISDYYLKKNGLVLFSFSNWTQNRTPDSVHISQKEYHEIIQWTEKDFYDYAKDQELSLYEKYFSLTSWRKYYNEYSEYLKMNYNLQLHSTNLYSNKIEPIINPILSKNKKINQNTNTKFLRWDMKTITEYNPLFKRKSFHSESFSKKPFGSTNILKNSQKISNIFMDINKVYMVPLSYQESEYILSRDIYNTYYKPLNFDLCDLGLLQPKEDNYIMQGGGTHMGNTGGLMKSILIAKWLKNYLK